MAAYEDLIQATSRPEAPWYVVPADSKPFARLVVAAALIEALEDLDLQYPGLEGTALKELQQVRNALKSEGSRAKEKKKSRRRDRRLGTTSGLQSSSKALVAASAPSSHLSAC